MSGTLHAVQDNHDVGSFEPRRWPNPLTLGGGSLTALDGFGELRHDYVQIAHDPQIAEAEDGRVLILVDRDNQTGRPHTGLMLHGAGDTAGDIDGRLDRLAGLAN